MRYELLKAQVEKDNEALAKLNDEIVIAMTEIESVEDKLAQTDFDIDFQNLALTELRAQPVVDFEAFAVNQRARNGARVFRSMTEAALKVKNRFLGELEARLVYLVRDTEPNRKALAEYKGRVIELRRDQHRDTAPSCRRPDVC